MAGRLATSVAQLVEHRSPKPAVGGSIPSARAPCRSRSDGPTSRGDGRGEGSSDGVSSPLHGGSDRRRPLVDRRAKRRFTVPACERRVHGQSQRRNAGLEAVEAPQGDAGRARRSAVSPRSSPTWSGPTSTSPSRARMAASGTRRSAWAIVLAVGALEAATKRSIPTSPPSGSGSPLAVGLVLGWLTFRLVQFPPFVEFLIATEAEMNKVSWTSRDDLYRATTVVLSTVVLMAVFLFGVDFLWSNLLQIIGVLQVRRRRRVRLDGRLRRAGTVTRVPCRSPRASDASTRSTDSPVDTPTGPLAPSYRVALHESSDRRDPRTDHRPGLDGQLDGYAGACRGPGRYARRDRGRGADPRRGPARRAGPLAPAPPGRSGGRGPPDVEDVGADDPAAPPPPRPGGRRAAAATGLVRPEGPEQPRGHDPRRPRAPGQDPGPGALTSAGSWSRPRRSPRSATTRSGSSSARAIPATSWSRWS